MKKQDKTIMSYLEEISYDDILNDDNLTDTTKTPAEEVFSLTPIRQIKLKENVLAKLNQSRGHSGRAIGILAAGILVCVFLSLFTPIGNKALAEIAKKLYFIPGLGKADVEQGEDTYILAKPVTYENGNRSLTIESIIRTPEVLSIRYSGTTPLPSSGFTIKSGDETYRSTSSTRSTHIGVYYFYSLPEDIMQFDLYVTDTDYIPITLTKAEQFEDYSQMGPTDIKNSFGLTLVPYQLDQQIHFDLVQHQTNRSAVSLYGTCDLEGHAQFGISIHDQLGRNYDLIRTASYMGVLSSFAFTPKDDTATCFIQIPKLTLVYPADNELTLPMPQEGETIVNQELSITGFPLTITKIIRKGDLVTVFIDTHYREEAPENINYLMVDMEKMKLDYYHWNLTDQNTSDFFEFYVNPKQKKLKLKFEKLYTILKGPWSFEIPANINP